MYMKIIGFRLSLICVLSVFFSSISAFKPLISVARIEDNVTYDYREFESDKTYVITAKTKPDGRSYVSYWIGDQASSIYGHSQRAAEKAAAYAVVLHSEMRLMTDILREAEGRETSHFRAHCSRVSRFLVALPRGDDSKSGYNGGTISWTINENETRMILIGASAPHSLDEVSFSPEYVEKAHICFVAFNSRIVFVHCGHSVSHSGALMGLAVYLRKIISKKMGPQVKILQNLEIQYDEKFEDEFRRVSVAVEEHKYEKFYVTQSRYLGGEAMIVGASASITSLFPFESEYCYMFDTCLEDIGVLVWMGARTDVAVRKLCAKNAEFVHKRDDCSLKRPIIFISEENVRLPEGEQSLQVGIKEFVKLMTRLNLSWTDVLRNEAAPSPKLAT